MSKRIRKSTQIRQARKEAANRKRAAFEFQWPECKRYSAEKTLPPVIASVVEAKISPLQANTQGR